MKSRIYAVYKNGFDAIWWQENFIGPENIEIFRQAFCMFYYRYYRNFGEEFVVFCAPETLGELPQKPNYLISYFASDVCPIFDKEKILAKLWPDESDVLEWIDPKNVNWNKLNFKHEAENLDWKY